MTKINDRPWGRYGFDKYDRPGATPVKFHNVVDLEQSQGERKLKAYSNLRKRDGAEPDRVYDALLNETGYIVRDNPAPKVYHDKRRRETLLLSGPYQMPPEQRELRTNMLVKAKPATQEPKPATPAPITRRGNIRAESYVSGSATWKTVGKR